MKIKLSYLKMLEGESLSDRIAYLDWMIDYYYRVCIALGKVGFRSHFRAEIGLGVQMMFSKAKSFRQLVDGYSHSDGNMSIDNISDHTVLFTIIRAACEQMCALELICVIPDTEEKKMVMENVYIASGLRGRHKLSSGEEIEKHKTQYEHEKVVISDCITRIHSSSLYKSLTQKEQKIFDKTVLEKCEYQIIFSDDGCKMHVGWDEVRKYVGLETDALHGLYKYACNMAHPSYLSLIQFKDGFDYPTMLEMRDIATWQLICIMSVYMCDFLRVFPEAKWVYDELEDNEKELADFNCKMLRKEKLTIE